MGDANMFSLAFETYQRLFPEIGKKIARIPRPSLDQVQANIGLTLSEALKKVQPLPPQSCMLGLCEDGIPFLLDLSSKETGSLLITGDPDSEKTHQLQVIVESAIRLNSPHELQIAVLTRDRDEWASFSDSPTYSRYFLGVNAWYEKESNDLIQRMVALGEDRSKGRHPGATILLIIDDLAGVFETDFEVQDGLHQLLEYGPAVHIRPVASLDIQGCSANPFWMNMFHTFLVGKITSNAAEIDLGFSYPLQMNESMIRSEFNAFTGETWMKYSLPMTD